ncbi:hypothetical protein [Fuscovulum blasticum]|uniref:hypothetical protein n=1 Tax=Fuscovulum blasticum TaxID=1075 RepID=UPI000D3EBE83|nr:hypothetical protein [Fuscovulum blasticum]AWD21828.1 hypothetical protein B6K69_09150 [Fuscovulum blasticum]
MAPRREYLITHYDRDSNKEYQLRAPKSANIILLIERLICRDLDTETLISSCLRANNKRAYDPFQIIDFREELRSEQAKAALQSQPESSDPIGTYNRAREAPIPIGKTLIVAGVNHEFFVKEVEA